MEKWVTIRNFPDYEINTNGRIRNIKTGRMLKTSINHNGYETVCLRKNKTQYTKRVHRLVVESFYDNDCPELDVNHIDGNKTNNSIDNLEYCTRKENIKHAIKNKLFIPNDFGKSRIKILVIETGETYDSINECGRNLGIDPSFIKQYFLGKVKSCKGYHFKKIN